MNGRVDRQGPRERGPARRHPPRRAGQALACALAVAAASTALRTSAAPGRDETPLLIIVAGVGGSPEHRERFSGWARDLCGAALATPVPGRVRVLVERPPEAQDAEDPCAPAGRSTRESLAREIESAGSAAGSQAGVALVLIGHGSGGDSPRFQIPGPDLAPEHLAAMLQNLPAGPVTVAQLASASGAFVPALSRPGRVVLAATRAHETNETRFPRHFIAAFAGGEGDRNKDGRLSVLEAFEFARRAVEREYEQEGLLQSEHALLDDNGDGLGSLEPAMAAGSDGVLAGRLALLVRSTDAVAASAAETPEMRRLITERDALAARVDALREAREGMEEEMYLAELEGLLLQIAELAERIAALREKSG